MTIRCRTAALVLTLCTVAPPAWAGIDVEIDAAAKVKSTLSPGETEVYRFEATAESLLNLTVARSRKATIDFGVQLFEPDGDPVDLTLGQRFKDLDKKIIVRKLPLTETGSYRLEITGSGAGDFKIALKAVPKKVWKQTLEPLAGSGTQQIAFSAPPGALVTFKAKAARGSTAEPRFGQFGTTDLTAEGKSKSNAHTVKKQPAGDGGDVTVDLTNRAQTDGDVAVKIVVAVPKGKPEKLDARGVALGAPTGGETLLARTVDDVAGGLVSIADVASGIDGAAVDIPGGALSSPARITVGSSDLLDAPTADTQSAGPAVRFGPDGLAFGSAATVTVPFDASGLPIGTNPLTDLQVLRVLADGTSETIAPSAVDVPGGLVSVPTTGFSTFMAFVPRGSPDLNGRTFWGVILELGFETDGAGMDSRGREVFLGVETLTFGLEGTPDSVTFGGENRETTVDNQTVGTPPNQDVVGTVDFQTDVEAETASWRYDPNGQHVLIDDGQDTARMAVSEDGRVLINALETGNAPFAFLEFFLEKPKQPLTEADVVGTYHFGAFEVSAFAPGQGPVALSMGHDFGSITLRADGTVTGRADGKRLQVDSIRNDVEMFSESLRATWSIAGPEDGEFEGSIIFTIDEDDETDRFRMLPSSDGNILVGTDADPLFGTALLQVAVRQAAGLKTKDLVGDYSSMVLEAELTSYPAPGLAINVPDFVTFSISETRNFDGVRDMSFKDFEELALRRDETQPGGVLIDRKTGATDDEVDTYSVGRNGKLTLTAQDDDGSTERFVGAVTQDLVFGFALDDPKGSVLIFGMDLFVKPPPLKLQ